MIRIVTVVDSISETSMPINEFVLFRAMNNYSIMQTLIVCTEDENIISFPSDIDIIHVNTSIRRMRQAIKSIVEKSKKNNEKLVFHLHSPKSAFYFYTSSVFMGVRSKTIFTVHSTYSARDLEYKITSSICALAAKYVTCVSMVAYNEYSLLVKTLKRTHIMPIVNGVDVNRIKELASQYKISKDKLNKIICVARIIPIKNQEFLIKVLKRLPNSTLLLVGEEDKEQRIRELAKKEGVLNRVVFTGLVSREKVFNLLSNSGIYVSASLVEGMPLSVLEAMCVGLIPIISNIPSHCEIAKEFDGLVNIERLDVEEWVSSINRVKEKNIQELENESLLIQKRVEDAFSLKKMHEKYLSLYDIVAEGK